MKVVAILQARVSSSRLPKKVLKPILGLPMLQRQLERLALCDTIDELILATSDQTSDDELQALVSSIGVKCFRGNLDDVLDRFYQAAKSSNAIHVVRLTGDCPLICPEVVDKVVAHHLDSGADYTSNIAPPTYPDGLDVEVMTISSLEKAWKDAKLQSEREHVTPYIRKPESSFYLENVKNDKDLSYLRWTVDEPRDFNFVLEIYSRLYLNNPHFTTQDILNVIDNEPELLAINQNIERNEGYHLSLDKDKY
ncbi:glycosyltransferase family protein [Vibrio coralliilyticus]|uniref:cytidylyltransferase domain-containing protein n=1 Tax=Vibrio coralliilyticus TaxID=190893 RepID=UPI0005126B72|nr:glycosyltransferase family protein [Vibrio coralliilyticus]AIU68117.1 spore coat protein [Vibrio coralliilyticus]